MKDLESLHLALTSTLMVAGRQWRQISEAATSQRGVSAACTAPLIFIGRLGEGVRQNVLADHVGIEGPSLVRLLDQLSRAGLIRREVDPADRRANMIWYTGPGKTLADDIEADLIKLRAHVFRDIAQDDIAATLRVFAAIGNAANTVDAPAGS